MTAIDITVSSELGRSTRVRQVSAMFDVPAQEKCELHWSGDFPYDAEDWNVGLIVGPSGSGKSTIAAHVFGPPVTLSWPSRSVVDDFPQDLGIEKIAEACGAVGFNTIPAWLRPHAVLSNGEKFRIDVARRVVELPDPIVVDEFTSVVDRQVAQIGSHAIQKYIRRNKRKFVAVACHYDIIDWLQPDWVLEASTMSFTRRRLQRRPPLECVIGRVHRSAWAVFAPYHYMSASLSITARTFGLWVDGRLAAFAGLIHRPHPIVRDIVSVSRSVTLPDWQGVGLNMVLTDTLGSAYKALGKRLHRYPAHPAMIRTLDRSKNWRMTGRPTPRSSSRKDASSIIAGGDRPCALFAYVGPAMDKRDAERLIAAESLSASPGAARRATAAP